MGNTNSHQPEPAPMMEGPRYPLPDFNDIFHKGVPKMMQVADDMHRMTNYIMDLRNMTVGLVFISIIGMLLFMLLKWNQGRRSTRNRRRYREFQNGDYGSEHSSLSRPYRTYPQKPADWSLHHKIDMDKMMEHPSSKPDYMSSGQTTPPATATSTASSVPNGGIKVGIYDSKDPAHKNLL
uniref:Uncharacterized protein n=1 Tax=Panagrolaimus sp. JU765 TaxID=591449 RepID=A0AC34QYI6_9BILA